MAAAQTFLDSVGLPNYLPLFSQHGFTESSQIANITEADLDKMKIAKKKERKAILKEAKKIQAKLKTQLPPHAPATASASAILSSAASTTSGALQLIFRSRQ